MSDHPFSGLPDRGKPPGSKRHLDQWIQQAQPKTGVAVGRLGWLVAATVVIAALQRARSSDGNPRFVLKGGAYLEVRLGLRARATKDIDTLFRGEFGEFLESLDAALAEPWGALELQRTEIETIDRARRVIKPVRFRVKLLVNGQAWRTIDVEVAADEGHAGETVASFAAPSLAHFGLPSPTDFAGIVFNYQVAQKFHASTDPHDPPEQRNDRARDLVDLLLIQEAFYPDGCDLTDLRSACVDIFEARNRDALILGLDARAWPPSVKAYDHWTTDYDGAARAVGQDVSLVEAAERLNEWLRRISGARQTPGSAVDDA